MDDVVLRAMRKWPDVPNAYHWLSLDRRGTWLLKGERIANPGVTDFIGRNYSHDHRGRWFFQNGPQRVFVTLALTPWIYRLAGTDRLATHTGLAVESFREAWCTTAGDLLLVTEHGVGALDDRDLPTLAQRLLDGRGDVLSEGSFADWLEGRAPDVTLAFGTVTQPLRRIEAADIAARFGFDPAPAPGPGELEC